MAETLGQELDALWAVVESRRGGNPDESYTASLMAGGPARCAKKFGEEAIEAVVAATAGDGDNLVHEAADTLYHLLVMMAASDVSPGEVAAALHDRAGRSGHDEKASRT